MKTKLSFLTAILFFTLNGYSQCPDDNVFYIDISPASNTTITENCMQSGKYITTNVIAGHVYEFSLCDNSGSDDTVLTLYTSTGTFISTDDDFCQPYSNIAWTANFTGSVRLLLDEYGCTSNSNCKILKVTHTSPDTSNCPINTPIICDAFNFTVTNTNASASTLFPNNNYGCLLSTQSPSWFYFRIGNNGSFNFNLIAPQDIDYILYGPFADLTTATAACGVYGTGGTNGNIISCSFSTSANELVSISSATTNQVYVLMVTNFAGASQSVDVTTPTGGGSFSCVSLGIESFESNLISIAPNPFHDVFEIQLDTDATIKIFDLTGKELLSKKYTINNKKVDLSELESGSYIMKVLTDEGKTKISKIIKQ